jgi:hypothetical protein
VKSIIAKNEYKNEYLIKEKEKLQFLVGNWLSYNPETNEIISNWGFYLSQDGKKVLYVKNEVFFDGINVRLKYMGKPYVGYPVEFDVIAKMVAPGRIEGVITSVYLSSPQGEPKFAYKIGEKHSYPLKLIKQ